MLAQTGCGTGRGCYLATPAGAVDCAPAGARAAGSPCAAQADCAPGLVCTSEVCSTLCRLPMGEPACPPRTRCVDYDYTPDGVGVCTR